MAAQEVLVRLKTLDEQLAEHYYRVAEIVEGLNALVRDRIKLNMKSLQVLSMSCTRITSQGFIIFLF